jgi:predicted kinase
MLTVFAGLPGAGKSTVAAGVADRLGAAVLAVDTVDRALQAMSVTEARPGVTAYVIVEALAEDQLRRGQPVVVDAVNAVEAARQQWRDLARRTDRPLRWVEVICSDPAVHRSRVEERHAADPWKPDWARVQRVDVEPWTDERIVVDTARHEPADLIASLVPGQGRP